MFRLSIRDGFLSYKFLFLPTLTLTTALACSVFSSASAQEGAEQTIVSNEQTIASTDQLSAIEKLSNEVLKAEIQLTKLSANYHAAWLKPNRFKSWRVFGYKIADSGLTNGGMITIAASRFKYAADPSKAPRSFLKAGHIINLTGASILVGGTLTEILLDRISERRVARNKQDPKSVLNQFVQLRKNLDDLLAERKTLVQSTTSLTQCQRDLIEADGLVLQDMRELVSIEFYHAYTEVAKLRGVRDTANATALISGITAGYLGSLQSLLSVSDRHPHQAGVAGLGFITSGACVATSPIIVKFGESMAKKGAVGKLRKNEIEPASSPQDLFDSHRARFEQLVSEAPPSETSLLTAIDARNTIYKLHNEMIDERDDDRALLKRKSKRILAERLLFSSIVGGTNIARGSLLEVAGFHYADVPTKNFRLVAAAATAFIAGSGVWTADNIQTKVKEELRERKIKSGKLSVHGKLLRDIEDLEQMEDQLSLY